MPIVEFLYRLSDRYRQVKRTGFVCQWSEAAGSVSFGHDTHTATTETHAPPTNSCDHRSYFIYILFNPYKGSLLCDSKMMH